ncbi:homoserine dehydrogenase [Streptomyces stelliscabiei]|uniref:Homoserine dehydrogenase n=1 Tax=Streptomyces stelliscabiei TaxID=146820 RepID=A0A8I0NVR3_9ACTN|nr:homoserine dehydrogenase [Streptomyces stelliscabiei]KND41804.1 homoserine dehydrogenase [Streptomyces stelliscabiei]MBE1594506.1 homoserine dehydrogenase [Streptomyces stelliscabiei]MDX2518838.1 homoserine dehydrogenase [Streptomyces stelliscabiei]MDX2556530.1 homoserine dehydrogenase [Streptomyces stelliscabiei]MDX2615210.1 homoserine dehydrogenase [Streptomyces stelliscabiei]
MTRYDLALIGFGGVNRALAELIAERGDVLEAELGFALRVVAITDLRAGSLVRTDGGGIDLAGLLAVAPGELDFSGWEGGSPEPRNEWVIREVPADIIAEATFTDPTDGEPALSHVRWAVEAGKHVCTTNKGPVALHGQALKDLARRHGVCFESEGTVMSGTPVLRTARRMFGGLSVHGFEGIMNGTSNYVLGRLESGLSFAEAVAEAQALGYAEADPTADIEGHDVQLKVVILANEVLGADLRRVDVPCTGLSALTADDVRRAAAEGLRWKLVGSATRRPDGTVDARVAPVALPAEHPLAGIAGPGNAIAFHTHPLGTVTVGGPGAGRIETAYALLSDVIAIHEHTAAGAVPGAGNAILAKAHRV